MFGFFSKKTEASAPPPPTTDGALGVDKDKDAGASGSTTSVQQLRTPSPSIAASHPVDLESPTPSLSRPPFLPQPSTPAHPLSTSSPAATLSTLQALISSVPPKTLHTYTLSHLPSTSPAELAALATFFATLTPPPKLHCVRCHGDFVEVENGDTSCRVQHDDDSAEVERVGRAAGGGASYQTLWACCGRTVEGDGDQGPPDGWCYEGKHTTDVKRARFRADATPADDKLQSCLRLNCHNVRATLPRNPRTRTRVVRPRSRSQELAEAEDDAMSSGAEDSGVDEIARGVGDIGKKKRARGTAKGKGKAKAVDAEGEDGMDVDDTASVAAGSTVGTKSPHSARGRGRQRKRPAESAKPKEKERGKDADADMDEGGESRRGRKGPGQVEVFIRTTRSQSRGGGSRSKVRAALKDGGAETADEGARTDGEGERRRKKRKLVAANPREG
ncbi:hypothetical protein OF83DRAFT_1142763 [Amylostereum chailletii]|nr:hypothetical protein OF83DRAFT_1142763 [Amylostereum chailletii]